MKNHDVNTGNYQPINRMNICAGFNPMHSHVLHLKIFLLSVCIEYLPDIAGIDM